MATPKKDNVTIDLMKFAGVLKRDKKKMLWCGCIAAVLGLAWAFSFPKTYKAGVTLAPESSNGTSLLGNISSLASMVGMNVSMGGGEDAIYPEIYPDMIESTDFIVSLFPVPVKTLKGDLETDFYTYKDKHERPVFFLYPFVWASELINKMKTKDPAAATTEVNPFMLTRRQDAICKSIRNSIDCEVDKKTQVISIVVEAQDPLIAASLCDTVQSRLQEYITRYRTQKAILDAEYIGKLCNEAKEEYEKAQQEYADWADSHIGLNLTQYKLKEQAIKSNMSLKYDIYQQELQQLQLAKARVQENTPAFTILQSIQVPIRHTNKSKLLVMLLFVILGCGIRAGMLFWKNRESLLIH